MALKKEDYIAALTQAKVALSGTEKLDDLKKLAEDNKVEVTTTEAPQVTGPITVKFRDHEGKPTERTFSKDVHGEDFADVADEFKKTNADKLITE